MSALHRAVEAGSEEEVKRLLSKRTLNIDAQDEQGYTALHRAIIKGNEKIAEGLIEAGACVRQPRGISRQTDQPAQVDGPNALHFAAAGGHSKIVDLIVDKEEMYELFDDSTFLNIRCSWQTEDGDYITTTPLLLAASGPSRQHEFVALDLLQNIRSKYQDPYYQIDSHRYTMLEIAVMKGHAKLLEWALRDGGEETLNDSRHRYSTEFGESLLHLAAKHGQISTAQVLLSWREDVNTRNYDTNATALHFAALFGEESMFRFLLEAGADPLARFSFTSRCRSYHNLNIAHLASHANNVGILTAALELGADFGATEANGCNALHLAACSGGGKDAIKFVLSTGKVPIDALYSGFFPRSLRIEEDAMDGTALHMACDSSIDSVCLLIDAGADVNFRTKNGFTPLHCLSSFSDAYGKEEWTTYTFCSLRDSKALEAAFRALIAAGADVNAAADNGITPLHVACWYNDAEAVALLLGLGADVTAQSGADKSSFNGDVTLSGVRFKPGFTPLHFLAISQGDISETVNIMTQSDVKVDLNAKDCDGNTPLHWVAWNADQVARNIRHYQEDPHETELFLQRIEGRCDKLCQFLEAGADACQRNAKGHTPLQHLHFNLLNQEKPGHKGIAILEKYASRLFIPLVAAGDFSWEVVPDPCPGLERALVAVWKKNPEELPQLFARLEPEVKDIIRECLRVFGRKMHEELRMVVLGAVFLRTSWWES